MFLDIKRKKTKKKIIIKGKEKGLNFVTLRVFFLYFEIIIKYIFFSFFNSVGTRITLLLLLACNNEKCEKKIHFVI